MSDPSQNKRFPERFVVTIDGVAASGKSSVAARVATELGVPYISSGLFYRAITLAALREEVDLLDEHEVAALCTNHRLSLLPRLGTNSIFLDGEDVTSQTHSSEVDAFVSSVARQPRVRAWVDAALRELPEPFVAEGRDMGSQVFPNARVKLYLTASARTRAQRRARERAEEIAEIEAALIERDARDALQSKPAADAIVIDTSTLELNEVVVRALALIRGQFGSLNAQRS